MAKTYTSEFKEQILELYNSGVPQHELMKRFGLSKSTVRAWRKHHSEFGSFSSTAALSPEAQELKKLRKENERLQKELNILKHAALILGTKKC
jgi:transposase